MRPHRKTERLQIECAPKIIEALETASERKYMSKSEFVRRAIIEALAKDGMSPIAA
jgi:metal-responsive CopG/Arc/MetJ family transcriptional regulator